LVRKKNKKTLMTTMMMKSAHAIQQKETHGTPMQHNARSNTT